MSHNLTIDVSPALPTESISHKTTADVVSWEGISYTVQSPTQGSLQILSNVSGYAYGGRLLAIMGASGSGKTSLMDILCNRKKNNIDGKIKGSLLINGEPRRSGLQHHFSYAPQHDLLLNTATVRETFETAALLRIPDLSSTELKSRVDAVLADLGLTHREHALVGGGEIRGLSGGERRRVSIGQEIVSSQNPVLCCDEPTTGLDSTTAESVVACLRDLARNKGTLVIATIHQPNSNITAMFDDFILMSSGHCVYMGPYSNAVARFSQLGFNCPLYCNPTDYFISVVAADPSHVITLATAQVSWLRSQLSLTDSEANRAFRPSTLDNDSSKVASLSSPTGSSPTMRMLSRLSSSNLLMGPTEPQAYPTSFTTQIYLLFLRAARQWIRNPEMLVSELIQYVFIALFLGGMYYGVNDSLENGGVFNRCSALFFLLSVMIFTPPFTAIISFAHERALMMKECDDKMYTPFAWLCAKTAVVFPIESILCLIFSSIVYWMVGFQPQADKFFLFLLIMVIFQLCAESLGLLFAIATDSPAFAIVWLSLILIVALSLSGFLTYQMPVYYLWIEQSNLMRFALLALVVNEFDGIVFQSSDGSAKVAGFDALPAGLKPDLPLGSYIAIMVGFLVILRGLVYVALLLQTKVLRIPKFIWNNSSSGLDDNNNSGKQLLPSSCELEEESALTIGLSKLNQSEDEAALERTL